MALIFRLCSPTTTTAGLAREHLVFGAKFQLVPAILAGNFAVVDFLLVGSLIFDPVCCAIICHHGLMQDMLNLTSPPTWSLSQITMEFSPVPKQKRRPEFQDTAEVVHRTPRASYEVQALFK